jgi:uncharacterized membrane protein YfcA
VSVGDLLEWVAAGLLVAAAVIWFGLPAGLAVGGVAVFYLAQSLSGAPVWRRRSDQ